MTSAPYFVLFRSLLMILFVPVMIFFVYFIDITLTNGIHTGYIVQLDRSSSLMSTNVNLNQKLILGVFEKRNENNGDDIRKGTFASYIAIYLCVCVCGVHVCACVCVLVCLSICPSIHPPV